MQIDNATDRSEKPEYCDRCEISNVPLIRYQSYGPGYQVDWLCHYCDKDYTKRKDVTVLSIIRMLHELERRLKK